METKYFPVKSEGFCFNYWEIVGIVSLEVVIIVSWNFTSSVLVLKFGALKYQFVYFV